MSESASNKKRGWSWFLWWQIDPAELDEQVEKYGRLNLFKSARGQSVLCLAFSVAVTVVLAATAATKTIDSSAYVDAAAFVILAVFIYFGHRWAMLAAMVLWTLEKGFWVVTAITIAAGNVGGGFVMQIVWWALYMHAFYLAFRVEQEKRRRGAVAIGSQPPP